MNSQIFPRANERLNKETHQQLLSAASAARRIRKSSAPREPAINFGPGARRPSLLEPLISAALTAAAAIQVALLVGI